MPMKIERIVISPGTIYYADSHETKKIAIDKKNYGADGLKYVEDYCNKYGFDLFDTHSAPGCFIFTIVKK